MRLLVTRPDVEGIRTASRLRGQGHEALCAPLTRIEPLPAVFGAGPWAALLFTSPNGPKALERHSRLDELLRLPCFAVGRRTAQAARLAGFAHVIASHGTVQEMATLVADCIGRPSSPLLYPAGEDRAFDLAAALSTQGLAVETQVVYRAAATADLPAPAARALQRGEIDGVLHFSRRSAEIYLALARDAGLHAQAIAPIHFCLSRRIAEVLTVAGAQDVRTAAEPAEDWLLRLVGAAG